MPEPLIVTRRDLNAALRDLPTHFRNVLGYPPREPLKVVSMPTQGRLQSYALVGREENNVIDLRDGEKPIVPIAGTEGRFHLAVGFDWHKESETRLRFVRLQMLAFLGTNLGRNDASRLDSDYRQVFRLEWEGTGADGSFEAVGAGHPHWQIDVLSTRRSSSTLSTLGVAIDLDEARAADEIDDNGWLQRMHLAALADWDGEPWPGPFDAGQHARLPRSLEGLTSWMLSACAYVQQELRR